MADNLSSASVAAANAVVPAATHNKIVDNLKADLAWVQKEAEAAEAKVADMWHSHEVVFIAVVAAVVGAVVMSFI